MTPPSQTRSRRTFLLIGTLFAAPFIAAWLYMAFPEWRPQGRTHHGELIAPARALPELAFTAADGAPRDTAVLRGRWSFVYLGGADCDTACADKLFQIRQVRTLLNEKRQRVQRVYIAPDAAALAAARGKLGPDHPDLVYLAAGESAVALRAFFEDAAPGTLFLLDPLGNYLMRYAPEADSPGLLADIKKLLRLSQIG